MNSPPAASNMGEIQERSDGTNDIQTPTSPRHHAKISTPSLLAGTSQPVSLAVTYSLAQPLPSVLPTKTVAGLQEALPVRKLTVATNLEDLKLELQKLHNSSVSSLSLKANIEQGLQAIFSQTVPAQTITTPAHSQPQVLSYVQPPSTPTAQSPVGSKLIPNHPLSQAIGGSQITAELTTTLSSSLPSTFVTTSSSSLPGNKIARFQITAVKDDPLLSRNSSCAEEINVVTISSELPQSSASVDEENLGNEDVPLSEKKGRFHVTMVSDKPKPSQFNGTPVHCDANANLISLNNESNDKSSQTCLESSEQKQQHPQSEEMQAMPSAGYKTVLTTEDHKDSDEEESTVCDDYLQQLLIRQQKERDELKKRHKQELETFKHERKLLHQKTYRTEDENFSSLRNVSCEARQCSSAQLFGSKLPTGAYQSLAPVNHLTLHSCQSPIVHSHVSRPNELKFGSRSNSHPIASSHSSALNIYSSESGLISPLSAPPAVGNEVEWSSSRNTLCRSSSEGIPIPGKQTCDQFQKPKNRTLTEDLVRLVQMLGSKPKSGLASSPTSTINAMTSEQKMTLNQIKQRQLQDMFIDVKGAGTSTPSNSPLSSPSMQRHINNLPTVPTQYRIPPPTIPINSQLSLDWQSIGSSGRTTTHSYITVTSAITHSAGSHLSSTFSHLPSSPPSPLSTCHGNHSPGK